MSNSTSPIFWLPPELLQHILSFNQPNPVYALVNSHFCAAHTDHFRKNIREFSDRLRRNMEQIFEQCSTGTATLNIFINGLRERCQIADSQGNYPDLDVAGVNKLHQLIVQKIQNFGIDCTNKYLSPQEIHGYSADIAAIEDRNLQRAWSRIRWAVIEAVPAEGTLLNPPGENASADIIRAWMDANVAALQHIRELNLSRRQLTCVPKEIALLTGLQKLCLDNNQIKGLPLGIFNGLVWLRRLYLGSNQIRELPVGIFSGLAELQILSLANNQIRELPVEIFNELVGLRQLNLEGNQIRKLPVKIFDGLVRLQELFLRNNQISELPVEIFHGLIGLQNLSLAGNQIRELPVEIFNGLVRLRQLHLGNNQIRELPVRIFNEFAELQKLDLTNNQISELPVEIFHGLIGLQNLSLTGNQIRTLPVRIFNGLVRLRRLSLSDNQISELPVGIFNGLVGLRWLSLNFTKIRELPVEIFNGLVMLQRLDLANNQMRELPVEIFNGLAGLQQLYLENNPRLLVFYKELQDSNSYKNIFNAFHQYICRSAFASFYQFAARGHALRDVIAKFHTLDQTTKNAIYGMVYEEAGQPTTDDLQWGEHHAFDDKGIFNGALKRYVRERFDDLSKNQKNAVYERVRELAQADPTLAQEVLNNPNWERDHAENNVLWLIDAMMAAAPEALLN